MTMLTHNGARFKSAAQGRRDTTGAANAHLAVIRRFGMCALMVLLAGGCAHGDLCRGAASCLALVAHAMIPVALRRRRLAGGYCPRCAGGIPIGPLVSVVRVRTFERRSYRSAMGDRRKVKLCVVPRKCTGDSGALGGCELASDRLAADAVVTFPTCPARSFRRSDRVSAALSRPPGRSVAPASGQRLRARAWSGSPP